MAAQSPEIWIKYYSSNHQILLVGEGDFGFSLSLALSFNSATNITTTSLDTYEELVVRYANAKENLERLKTLGATLIHGVDATKMGLHPSLQGKKFDRVVYNFPHSGFHSTEDDPKLIEMHRNLVRGFFQNASTMVVEGGEIHLTHKVTHPFNLWKVEELAAECSLTLIGKDLFQIEDYNGYKNKKGSGPLADLSFVIEESRTYRFRISSPAN